MNRVTATVHCNWTVSCIYRPASADIDRLRKWMVGACLHTNNHLVYIRAHSNMDILNPCKHRATDKFINTMYTESVSKDHSTILFYNCFQICIMNKRKNPNNYPWVTKGTRNANTRKKYLDIHLDIVKIHRHGHPHAGCKRKHTVNKNSSVEWGLKWERSETSSTGCTENTRLCVSGTTGNSKWYTWVLFIQVPCYVSYSCFVKHFLDDVDYLYGPL